MDSNNKLVATFSALRRITETDTEFVIEGHCGTCGDIPDERFSKVDCRVERDDNSIRVYQLGEQP